LLLLVGLADCDISQQNYSLRIDSNVEALYFENVERQPGYELYTITTVVEDTHYGATHKIHYFSMYECPTAQNNYVKHYYLDQLDELIDDLLEYIADVLGDEYLPRVCKYVTTKNAEIVDQLKAIATAETVRDRMPEFAEALLSKLSKLEVELEVEDEDC